MESRRFRRFRLKTVSIDLDKVPAWLNSSPAIYQLRVVLCGVSPLVWRRLLVISETSLAELHEILQSAFDWSGEHLHRFLIHGAAYGVPCLGGITFRDMPRFLGRNADH
jgi:hypothetical protein